MQFLISLEGGSLFFSCRTISFIHYLRYDFHVEEKGRERMFQDIMQQTENGHHVISLATSVLQIPSAYKEMSKYHARGIFFNPNFITSVYRDID